nr:DNA polymerase III subunit alpha [Rathayibacter iranicus]
MARRRCPRQRRTHPVRPPPRRRRHLVPHGGLAVTGFPHLHTASAHSFHYGVTPAPSLVAAAVDDGAGFLALTDRDGLYGAPAHIGACITAGISPGLGVDVAMTGEHGEQLGRVVLLAHGQNGGRGYAQLCRAVSLAHHGVGPTKTIALARSDLAAVLGEEPRLTVIIGPTTDVGRAIDRRALDDARTALRCWRQALPAGVLTLEVVCHLAEPSKPGSVTSATKMLSLAEETRLPAVLTNAARYGAPEEAATADLADAARSLKPLATLWETGDLQPTGQAWLKPARLMRQVARMVVGAGSHRQDAVALLLAATERLAEQCALDPVSDIGWGIPRMPEASIIGIDGDPMTALWNRARAGVDHYYARPGMPALDDAHRQLEHEMKTVEKLGMPSYFLTVARVAGIIRGMGVRIQARGSGVGSVLNYALHTSSVEPISNGLIFERFLSPERTNLPDIDLDVESARRHDIYREVFKQFGSDRTTLMSMTSAYRSRGAVRDAGLALGLDDDAIDSIAKQLWRFNAREFREALAAKPELSDLAEAVKESEQLDLLVDLSERLDRLPRHVSVHPCGVILSDTSLLDRTPVELAGIGLPMSQFDKHAMDPMGLIKLDILGVRMQSAMAHAVTEHERLTGTRIDIDNLALDDEPTFELLRSTRTLGVFQLESPGQMELVGKLQPTEFNDLTVEISLFRPGPMQNNMPLQYLRARHGEVMPDYIDSRFRPFLRETRGVVVFHEQVMRLFDELTGCGLGHADVLRRQLADRARLPGIASFVRARAEQRGFTTAVIDRAWQVLKGFGSFGFAKAHGAAFALPTYQSAWLKRHHPAEFMAGLLTHDPGMWPKDLIVAEARHLGVPLLPIDVQLSTLEYIVEPTGSGTCYGVRMSLEDLVGSSAAERARIAAHQPFSSLQDFRDRVRPRRATLDSLVRVGALDGFINYEPARRHELLAHLSSVRTTANRINPDQLAFDFDLPVDPRAGVTSLELHGRTQTDLELKELRLAINRHQMESFYPLFLDLGVTPTTKLSELPGGTEVIIAGVRRATNTPPMRGGKRVVFVSLDDGTGPVSNIVFFHDAQEQIGSGVFQTHYMLVKGRTRRAGARGVSVTGDQAWDLLDVQRAHTERGATLAQVTPLRRKAS